MGTFFGTQCSLILCLGLSSSKINNNLLSELRINGNACKELFERKIQHKQNYI